MRIVVEEKKNLKEHFLGIAEFKNSQAKGYAVITNQLTVTIWL